jgi:hypothetical protein
MADLLVHFATAWLPARGLRDGRLRAVFYAGVCLPDVLYKALLYFCGAPTWLCEPTHAPLGLVPWCYAIALLFEPEWRRRAFVALLGGSWLHLLVDLGKNYMGSGVILWAFPFSMDRIELGWYYPEDTVYLLIPAAAFLALAEGVRAFASRAARPRSRA